MIGIFLGSTVICLKENDALIRSTKMSRVFRPILLAAVLWLPVASNSLWAQARGTHFGGGGGAARGNGVHSAQPPAPPSMPGTVFVAQPNPVVRGPLAPIGIAPARPIVHVPHNPN